MTELSKAWNDIYATFDENAFDYVGKPFYMDDDSIVMWDGASQTMTTYYPAPF